jgi:hypothetical protein
MNCHDIVAFPGKIRTTTQRMYHESSPDPGENNQYDSQMRGNAEDRLAGPGTNSAESLKVAQSNIGFTGLISEDEQMMFGHAWLRGVMASCVMQSVYLHFPIDKAGVWAESVKLKRPVIINDYEASRPGGEVPS